MTRRNSLVGLAFVLVLVGASGAWSPEPVLAAAPGTWSATGSLATPRDGHTATLLSNGKVLVAGGGTSTSFLASAELYDPVTGTWSATGSMATPRFRQTATLLSNGKVLVAGGENT